MEIQVYRSAGINSAGEEVPSIRVDAMFTPEEDRSLIMFDETMVLEAVKKAVSDTVAPYLI